MDAVWAIWSGFRLYDGMTYGEYLMEIEECASMTRAALKHGCDIEDTIPYNSFCTNPLFEVNIGCWKYAYQMAPIQALRQLVNAGYELESCNAEGATPLLFAATRHAPHIIERLKLFVKLGVHVHAVDTGGRGALHCALGLPADTESCLAAFLHNTEDESYYEEDYNDDTLDPTPLLGPSENAGDDPIKVGANDFTFDYVLCKSHMFDNGAAHMIKHQMQVHKKRTRFKLLTLLQAGCDPNVVDNNGESPSDYAMRDGLWPQWSWALLNAGYIYHRRDGRVKSAAYE